MRGSKRHSRCTGLRRPQGRCSAPEGGSHRGAHHWVSRRRRRGACCRRHCWGGGVGRQESARPPTTTSHSAGGPLLGLGHLLPTLHGTPATISHGDMGGGGGMAAGGWVSLSHSSIDGRKASVALASCLLVRGGCGHPRWLHRRPRLHYPSPLQLWGRPAAGAGGRDGGARAPRTFLAPSRPRSLMRRWRIGQRVTKLQPASTRGLRGDFGMGRVEVAPLRLSD